MTPVQWLYILGAPPALAFPVYYWITARWWQSKEGRLFMMMALLPFFMYLSPMIFLFVPRDPARDVVRIILGVLAATVSWSLVFVYRRIRKEGLAAIEVAMKAAIKQDEERRGTENAAE